MNVKISWALPFNNYADIDMYRIYIRDTSGNNFNLDEVNCNGSNPQIITERFCLIPMNSFRQAPHNLVLDQEIVVKIQAHNIRGWGLFGQSTGGLHVQSEPDAMDIPFRNEQTTNKQIVVEWSLLPSNRIG